MSIRGMPIAIAAVQWDDISPHVGVWRTLGRRRMQQDIIPFDIKEFGRRALFRFANRYILPGQKMTDLGSGIIDIAGDDCLFGTDDDACWLQADVYPVGAVVALGDCAAAGIYMYGVVRAGLHACLATDTNI